MIYLEHENPPLHIYPPDPWKMIEREFYPRYLPGTETIFSTANGYLGMRGLCEEGTPVIHPGTFINGFYEVWPIVYGENAFGFAKNGQTIVNVPDSTQIRLYVDDEPFYLPTADLLAFERILDMKRGVVDRYILWETPSGKNVSIRTRRLVSFEHRHLAAIEYTVKIHNASAPMIISSKLVNQKPVEKIVDNDPRRSNGLRRAALKPAMQEATDMRVLLGFQTANSQLPLGCGIDHTIDTECSFTYESPCWEDAGKTVFNIHAEKGKAIKITKYISYHTDSSSYPAELCGRVRRTLTRAREIGFQALQESQENYMADFWYRSDIEIGGDVLAQQAVRFNLFQLCQATARADGAGVAAKGLTGSGYEGHYFWDTEIYVMPFLTYTAPRLARNLLRFRYGMLDKARIRAAEVNQKGALFPWRTISGDEASAYYAAGTAQYHINADIIYGLKKYVEATGDLEFLYDQGAEMLVETARLWCDLGFFNQRDGGSFCIHGVTGPDEYTTVVNNNVFTNLMARENLWYAANVIERLREEQPARFDSIQHRTRLRLEEIAQWREAADKMALPYDEALGIHPQDDNFLDKEPWDFDAVGKDKYPLLLHYHPLVIYRHQVIKQADVVLAMFLLGHQFTEESKRRNFDYYDPITTGDSSLSACIQAIMAFELGYPDKARKYFMNAVLMDLADVGGNVKDGCHIASMGGTWMAIIYGFAGMRDYDGVLSFNPHLPKRRLHFKFAVQKEGRRLEISLNEQEAAITYRITEGEPLRIIHCNEPVDLQPGEPATFPLENEPGS